MGRPGEGPGLQGTEFQELVDIRPGDEGAAGAGEQQHPDLRVSAHLLQGVLKLREHLVVQDIEPVRAVEGDGGNARLLVK
jgi:hypothetical protein